MSELEDEVSSQREPGGRGPQAEASARVKAWRQAGSGLRTSEEGCVTGCGDGVKEEFSKDHMGPRWDRAMGHCPNVGFYSE